MNRQRRASTAGMRGGTCAALGVFCILVGCNVAPPGTNVDVNPPPCATVECENDAIFCNGVEACVDGKCESNGNPCAVSETCDESHEACVPAAPPPSEPGDDVLPDFSLGDVNPNSSRYQEIVSPRDYLGEISVWYFGHST